jgi:hypothetical protein
MRYVIFAVLLIQVSIACAQQTVYVNTANLVLRDRPEKQYNVFAVLQPGCPLKIESYEAGYKNDKKVTARFYQVSIDYRDNENINHHIGGWVEKNYVSQTPKQNSGRNITELMKVVVPDDNETFNASQYPPLKYKGAEIQPGPPKRIYHKGPRGGCYYLNGAHKKVYVDKSLCK